MPSGISLVHKSRVFPSTKTAESRRASLSWVDCTVARFAPAACVWIYSAHEEQIDMDKLQVALAGTLNYYRPWSGQLEWLDQPFGKMCVSYGLPSDPGALFVVAECEKALSEYYPTWEQRAQQLVWECNDYDLLTAAEEYAAFHNLVDHVGLACLIVQATKFACGGVSIGIRITHPLADAQSMIGFVHNWATVYKTGQLAFIPLFDSSLVDQHAEGETDLIEKFKSIPVLRYDWWASDQEYTPDCPPYVVTHKPKGPIVLQTPFGEPKIIPWKTYDALPARTNMVYFSPKAFANLYARAQSQSSSFVSHVDVLCATIWSLITKARELPSHTPTHLCVTVGFRPRLSPALPKEYTGSPIFLSDVQLDSNDSTTTAAESIRKVLQQMDSAALASVVYAISKYGSPMRYWNAFLGSQHSVVTSWARTGVQDISFIHNHYPRNVDSMMPVFDGIFQIMEAQHIDSDQPWHTAGMLVSVTLENETMDRFVNLALAFLEQLDPQ